MSAESRSCSLGSVSRCDLLFHGCVVESRAGFFNQTFGKRSFEKETKIIPSAWLFVVMKKHRGAGMVYLRLLKSKDGTKSRVVISAVRIENRPMVCRDVVTLDKCIYVYLWKNGPRKSVLIHSGTINPKELVFGRRE